MRRLVLAVTTVACVFVGSAALADTAKPDAKDAKPDAAKVDAKAGPGTAVVKQANDQIAALLKQKVTPGSPEEKSLGTKVMASVRDFLDVDELGKAAMTDHWSKLSKTQQDDFLKTLRSLIETNYVNGLRANLSYTVDYAGETTDKDGKITVATKINTQRKGRPYSVAVDYVLEKHGDKLRAVDVKTDGVSLVDNYRASWNKIMTKEGFDGLLKRMRDKQAQLAAQKS